MLFFMDLGGDVLRIDADKIYQGTQDAGIIRLVTPITPANTTIEVAFTYPNGLSSTYYPLAVVGRYSLSDLLATDYVNAPQTTQVYLWTITMPENVTADDGTVIATFKLTQPANVEAYASIEQLPETGESGVYYLVDGVYYTWNGTDYYPTTDTISVVGNVYMNVTTSPCPFTVLYASLPSPPEGATVTEIEQILTLLNQYATQTQGQVITNTENIEDLDERLTTAESDIEDLQTAVGDWEDLLDALNGRVTACEETVADAVERVNTVESEFAEVKDEYDNVVGDIAELQAIVGDGTGTESLTARMTQAEDDIDDLQTAISGQAVDISGKMDKANPTGTGSLSMNRRENTAVGTDSVTLNDYNTASGATSTAIGFQTQATGKSSFSSGTLSIASGELSHAEGNDTRAIKKGSHAEGNQSQAGGTHSAPAAIGSRVSGYSHAEGYQTYADGSASHTEGQSTWTDPDYGFAAHAEGIGTQAAGSAAHAEGGETQANAGYSHAEGRGTIANGTNQHVGGKYNIADNNGDYAEIIGNGTSSTRSNARTLDWSGNEKIAGDMTVNKTTLANQSATDITVNLPSSAGTLALQSAVDTAQQKADDAYDIAVGKDAAISFVNYQSMVAAFNAESAANLQIGDNIYIETVGVPDLWVAEVLTSKVSYTYTTDQAIVDALDNPSVGYVNIGWYRLCELETAKVDLSGYVETTTTVNGHALSGDVTVTKADVGLGNVDNVRQYSASNPPPYPVTSVNGETGAVSLSIPSATSDLTNDSGFITSADLPTVNNKTITIQKNGTTVESFTLNQSNDETINITLAKGDVGLGNVANELQYSANNPPPYPVTDVEVNGTSVVVNKVAEITVPTKVSELTNDAGYVTAAQIDNPVTSVNGQTGDVVLSIPTKTSDLTNDSGFITSTTANATYLKKTGGGITGDLDVVGELTGGTIEEGGVALSTKYTLKTDFNNVVDGTTQVGDAAKLNGQQPSYYLNYNNLSNKPTIPTVNNSTITFSKNGTSVGDITLNQASAETINFELAKTDVGLGNVDNVRQYSASNPPPYPVSSVNGKTGAVTGLATSNPNLLINSNFAINQRDGYFAPVGTWAYSNSALGTTNRIGILSVPVQTTLFSSTVYSFTGTIYIDSPGGGDTYTGTVYFAKSDCTSGYVGTANAYTVDRWIIYTGGSGVTVEPITNGGVTVSNNSNSNTCDLTQIIEDGSKLYSGKVLTLSVNTTIGGSIATTILSGTLSSAGTLTENLPSSSGQIHIQLMSSGVFKVWLRTYTGKTVAYNWAKLEIGSIATEYTPPLIAEELPKCLRYFYRLQSTDTIFICEGHASSTTVMFAPNTLPVPMRATPTMTYSALDDFNLYGLTGTAIALTNLTVSRFDALNRNHTFNCYGTGFTNDGNYVFRAKNANAHIDFDAEIY